MGYSNDLRVRVIQVVEGGAAARQFVIGDATAIRWAKRWRETGSFEAKSNKGKSWSPLKKHEEWLLGLVRQEPDLTLEDPAPSAGRASTEGPAPTGREEFSTRS
jgi:transposase